MFSGSGNKSGKHVIDVLFTLALFCVFATASLMVVLIGANVYQSTIQKMDLNFELSTSITYVTTKIRQHDAADSVFLSTLDGRDALVLEEEFYGEVFQTWIYHHDGSLRELFIHKDNDDSLHLDAGQELMRVYRFTIEQARDNLFSLTATSADGESARRLVAVRS